MEYYLKEIREETISKVAERNAGGKAREDVSAILDKMGIHNRSEEHTSELQSP